MANNKILVVDDDPNIAQLINVYLTREGYEVETCDRGDKAVERFKANPPNLMLLDLMLPGMTVNISSYTFFYRGKELDMPPKEIELLYFLASHPNIVFTREQLLEQVWGYDFFGDSRTVDVHIKRLREKLPNCEELGWQLRTVWSVGYKFEVK